MHPESLLANFDWYSHQHKSQTILVELCKRKKEFTGTMTLKASCQISLRCYLHIYPDPRLQLVKLISAKTGYEVYAQMKHHTVFSSKPSARDSPKTATWISLLFTKIMLTEICAVFASDNRSRQASLFKACLRAGPASVWFFLLF